MKFLDKIKELKRKAREHEAVSAKLEKRYIASGEYDPERDRIKPSKLSFILAIPVAIFAGIYFVIKQIFTVLLAVLYIVYTLLFATIGHALGTIIVLAVVGGGIYIFLQNNPELTNKATEVTKPLMGKTTLYDAFSSDEMKSYYIPRELDPIMSVPQNIIAIERYKYLITSGEIGNHGEGAISLLSGNLRGNNEELRGAAYEALLKIATPEAKRAIEEVDK